MVEVLPRGSLRLLGFRRLGVRRLDLLLLEVARLDLEKRQEAVRLAGRQAPVRQARVPAGTSAGTGTPVWPRVPRVHGADPACLPRDPSATGEPRGLRLGPAAVPRPLACPLACPHRGAHRPPAGQGAGSRGAGHPYPRGRAGPGRREGGAISSVPRAKWAKKGLLASGWSRAGLGRGRGGDETGRRTGRAGFNTSFFSATRSRPRHDYVARPRRDRHPLP